VRRGRSGRVRDPRASRSDDEIRTIVRSVEELNVLVAAEQSNRIRCRTPDAAPATPSPYQNIPYAAVRDAGDHVLFSNSNGTTWTADKIHYDVGTGRAYRLNIAKSFYSKQMSSQLTIGYGSYTAPDGTVANFRLTMVTPGSH
jgi:hypothetical protein